MNVQLSTTLPDPTGHPPVPPPALAPVLRGDVCSGCGACAVAARGGIRMQRVAPGVLRPRQTRPLAPAEEAKIVAVCPSVFQHFDAGPRRTHPLWGPWLDVRTGHATDPELRHAASSGGVLSALLCHLLESRTVDVIVQARAADHDPLATQPDLSFTAPVIRQAAGSRYAPSAPLLALGPAQASGQRIAFVGKPCDVSALRKLAMVDDRIARQIVVTLSFFCAGVPARRGAEEMLSRMGVSDTSLRAFRYRGNGWPGRAVAHLMDGSQRSLNYEESWGGILSRHVQKRCKICPDGVGHFADITCADAWHAGPDGGPSFTDAPGRGLVIARTERGADILRAAVRAGVIATQPYDLADLAAIQPGQRRKRQMLAARRLALHLLRRPVPEDRGFGLLRHAVGAGLRTNLRQFAGMLRREMRLRRRKGQGV